MLKTLLTLALAVSIDSCGTLQPGMLQAEDHVDLVTHVVERTDGYIETDDQLTDAEAQALGAQTQALLNLFSTPGPVSAMLADVKGEPVFVLHDLYVAADASLLPIEAQIYLNSTTILRDNIQLALQR